MRRTIPWAVAVVTTTIAVLAVMTSVGVGVPRSSKGGTPTAVFMTTDSDVCHEGSIGRRHKSLLPTAVEVTETSHLLMYFTGVWSGIDAKTALLTDLWLANADLTRQSGGFIDSGGPTHHFGTMMWTFRNVPAGSYNAEVAARVSPGDGRATMQSCALTVFVMPVA